MHLSMFLNTMSQRLATENLVHIPSSITNVLQIPVSFKLTDNTLNRAFRDSNLRSYISNPFKRVLDQAQQDMCMIRQKSPRRGSHFSRSHPHF
jgi:hypothetical protein